MVQDLLILCDDEKGVFQLSPPWYEFLKVQTNLHDPSLEMKRLFLPIKKQKNKNKNGR